MTYKYGQVKKGAVFTPLRAMGLALELAFQLGCSCGFMSVQAGDLQQVSVTGKELYVRSSAGQPWTRCPQVLLEVVPGHAEYVVQTYIKLLAKLHSLGLNIFRADVKIPGQHGSHDLTAAFMLRQCLAAGMISVELKMRSFHRGWAKVLGKLKEACEERLKMLSGLKSQSTFQGILLVVVWCSKAGGAWTASDLAVELLTKEGWKKMQAPVTPVRSPVRKPLSKVFNEMTWHRLPMHRCLVGKVAHFLKALGKTTHDVASSAKMWNKNLPRQVLKIKKVKFSRGDAPWVGSKVAFRRIYKYL